VDGAPNGIKRAKMVVVESTIEGRPSMSKSTSLFRLSRASGLIWPRVCSVFT